MSEAGVGDRTGGRWRASSEPPPSATACAGLPPRQPVRVDSRQNSDGAVGLTVPFQRGTRANRAWDLWVLMAKIPKSLAKLDRNELQKLAKAHGVAANATNAVIRAELEKRRRTQEKSSDDSPEKRAAQPSIPGKMLDAPKFPAEPVEPSDYAVWRRELAEWMTLYAGHDERYLLVAMMASFDKEIKKQLYNEIPHGQLTTESVLDVLDRDHAGQRVLTDREILTEYRGMARAAGESLSAFLKRWKKARAAALALELVSPSAADVYDLRFGCRRDEGRRDPARAEAGAGSEAVGEDHGPARSFARRVRVGEHRYGRKGADRVGCGGERMERERPGAWRVEGEVFPWCLLPVLEEGLVQVLPSLVSPVIHQEARRHPKATQVVRRQEGR